MPLPSLVGVVHLPPLPGSPRFGGNLAQLVAQARADAALLQQAGFDAVMVENFGDAPFYPDRVPPITVAAMTTCALAVADLDIAVGVNVLRNDAEAALAVAAATGASLVRINVHTGARLTDQGLVTGRAHETLRLRRALQLDHVKLLCDVAVKHSAAVGPRPIAEEACELAERGGADAVLITGSGTGAQVDDHQRQAVLAAVDKPVYVASGATPDNLEKLGAIHGVIVGSWLRADGQAGGPIDAARAHAFATAWHERPAAG